jgi:hypothetical protein
MAKIQSMPWMAKFQEQQDIRATRKLADPGYFVRGFKYTSTIIGGTDPKLEYTCVHTSGEMVVFTFEYQGRERVHHAYFTDIKEGDYRKVNPKRNS